MNLARSDTFINIYIPRADGDDPRRYVHHNSPVFNAESVYKFSDQIVKDRPLFRGRKALTMYDMLTKNGRIELNSDKPTVSSSSPSFAKDRTLVDIDRNSPRRSPLPGVDENGVAQTSLRTVSLDLDSQGVRKIRRPTKRFNEPLNAYITNRKRAQLIHKYQPVEQAVYRQITSLNYAKKDDREDNDNSDTSMTLISYTTPKKVKSKSAIEIRAEKTMDLPPIHTKVKRSKTAFPPLSPAVVYNTAVVRAMPVRPSSKPQKIWKQSTEFLAEKPNISMSTPTRLSIRPLVFNQGSLGYQVNTSFPVK